MAERATLRHAGPSWGLSFDLFGERPRIAPLLGQLVGDTSRVAIEAYDGSRVGPAAARATIVVRAPAALRRIVTAPGELGFARAYVAGDLELRGDVFEIARLAERIEGLRLRPGALLALLRVCGVRALHRPPLPATEIRLHGTRHSRARDAAAIAHHYDVSNDFFRTVLGPSLTYSCAVFRHADDTLEQAQEHKHELVCRKLGLRPGMRLLDVGCGWGSLLLHAARRYGVHAVGVTLSHPQAELAARRIAEAGLADRVAVRVQDYRDVADDPYDAISSIGMFEHVGLARLEVYFRCLLGLLRPGGRLLNHGISRGTRLGVDGRPGFARRSFMNRYVFPDAELHEVGSVVSAVQRAGFEACHVEGLRDHYATTLRHWVTNLERGWGTAARVAGAARARVWRLYMAASTIGFESNRTSVHQILAVRPTGGGTGMPLRPDWDSAS